MIVRISWDEKIRFKPALRFLSFLGVVFGYSPDAPKFFIVKDENKERSECLCDKCNTRYIGHYGVGYYSCKNSDRFIVI